MPEIANFRNRITKARNFYYPASTFSQAFTYDLKGGEVKKNLTYYITRVQFARLRQDIQSWRDSYRVAEQMFFPFRAPMQRIFLDTILNEHVDACMRMRRRLTMLRDFKICDDKGKEDESLKLFFRNRAQKGSTKWFNDFLSYSIDSLFFGYTLIYLDDLVNNAFPNINCIRRENISPDRLNVSSLPMMVGGIDFTAEPFSDWHIWVPTPGETGRESCGYGLLAKIAKSEIVLRNNLANNSDYNQTYGQPIRKGKTTKTDPDERNNFEMALKNMGSDAYILLDDEQDDVELVESKNAGTGHQTFSDLEKRLEAKISKVMLGHADALESTPGKLGSSGGAGQKANQPNSPQEKALAQVQAEDGLFVESVINSELIPRMQKFGFPIPPNFHFEFSNNMELAQERQEQDDANQKTANIMLTIAQAGGVPDWNYFSEQTGINVTEKPDPPIEKPGPDDEPVTT
jgi:hypothetical protein